MRQRLILAFAVFAFVVGLVFPRAAQAQTAASSTIVGTVTDQSNAVIPGATIKLTNIATGVSLTTTANGSGQYTFPTVTPGTYTVTVTKSGFKNAAVQHLIVDIARSYTVNVSMQVGAVSQSVTVEAGASVQLETTTAQVGGVVNDQEMDKLPTLNHQATELITIQPSVSPGMGDNTFPMPEPRFSGAIDDQNTYTLDGIDISDNLVGAGTWIPVNIDSVQELDTGVTNPNATFGRSSGGQINLLGRHGTNEYHGSVYWYTQNSALNANSWDNNAAGIKEPHLVDNRGGVRFGGPIFKNKTFIFANYELDRFPQSTTFTRTIPTSSLTAGILTFKDASGNPITYNLATDSKCGPSGNAPCDPRGLGISPTVQDFWKLMPSAGNFGGVGDGLNETGFRGTVSTPLDTDFGVLRLDHNFTDKWRFSGSYSYWRSIGSGGQISILNGNPTDPSSSPIRSVVATGQLTTLISPTLTNTFRFGWVRNWQNFQVESPAVSAAQFNLPMTATGISADPYVAINPAEGLLGAPIDNTSSNARFQDYFEKTIQFTDNFDWINGKHTFEFGTDDRRLPLLTDRADKVVNGITSLVTVMDTVDGTGAFLQLPASDSPEPCSASVTTNCLPPNQLSNWNQLYAGALGLTDNTSILAVRDGQLNPLPFGTPLSNNTVQNQFYFYGQDTWRLTNSLTLSYGLAYGWQTPPKDTLGRQTILIDATTGKFLTAPQYLQNKMSAALQGQIYNPTTGYVPVNSAHHPVFSTDWGDVAPRISAAWNPSFTSGMLGRVLGDRKTVIRGGYSLVYDRESTIETVVIPMLGVGFGQTINSVTPQCSSCSSSTNPAVSDFRVGVDGSIPLPTVPPSSNPVIPTTPFGEILSFQDDPAFKVGRSTNLDLDIQRELPHNLLLEVGYIGHMGSRLPSSVDINNSPYFFVDPTSKQSFAQAFDAVTAALQSGQTPTAQPFFENQLPGYAAATCGGGTNTACLASSPNFFLNGLTQSLFQTMDLYRFGQGLQPYDNLQTVLSELRTYVGTSKYNGFIVSITKKTSSGLTLQANYTLSKSLDQGLVNQDNAGYYLNSFDINASYGPSIYDRRHLITGDFVYQLPMGGGHRFHLNDRFDRALSGWYWSGIFEAYSGLPTTVGESAEVWGVSSIIGSNVPAIPLVSSASLKSNLHSGVTGSNGIGTATDPKNGGTGLNIFANPAAAFADFRNVKLSTDGRDGSANPFYGMGMWNFDMSLGKSTTIHEKMTLDFSAQFLNVFNNVNFQTPGQSATAPLSLQSPSNFGEITSTFVPANRTNSARWIELGLRFSF
ncbi:MAG TPA: carboxypeptidase-like regulatory domain-containing protein [Candidatus Acidoferrales bacterium]|nr:carboxypeptidase-like regulatory domain-containing protein [Candidatus Acidoferrales bacterium]